MHHHAGLCISLLDTAVTSGLAVRCEADVCRSKEPVRSDPARSDPARPDAIPKTPPAVTLGTDLKLGAGDL